MNEQSARAKGLVFTGHFDYGKEDIKKTLEVLRDQGYKAYLVTVQSNPLSRGTRTGYSIYAERKYSLDQEAERLRKQIADHPVEIARLRQEVEAKIDQLKAAHQERVTWMVTNGYSI